MTNEGAAAMDARVVVVAGAHGDTHDDGTVSSVATETPAATVADGSEVTKSSPAASRRNPLLTSSGGTPRYTLKIHKAVNIKGMDANGKSDAYCTLTNYKGKPKSTKVIMATLNPIWNETFIVRGPTLRISMYDKDLMSADDMIGYADIDLQSAADGTERDFRMLDETGHHSHRGHLLVIVYPGDTRPKGKYVPGHNDTL
ncbi:hypothetical protein Pelo_7581 [Pelomyxa schiedti]|nr:hypothetical protein Pelo_7581 [Pelomyxa schiedti]